MWMKGPEPLEYSSMIYKIHFQPNLLYPFMCSDSHKEFGKFTPLGGKFYLQSTVYKGSYCSFKRESVEGRILHSQEHTQQEAPAVT